MNKVDAAGIGGTMLVVGFIIAVVSAALDMPEVHVSQTTGECVRILTPEGERPCTEIPARYVEVTVK